MSLVVFKVIVSSTSPNTLGLETLCGWDDRKKAWEIDSWSRLLVPSLGIKVISVLCYYLTAASNRRLVQTSGCKVHKTLKTWNTTDNESQSVVLEHELGIHVSTVAPWMPLDFTVDSLDRAKSRMMPWTNRTRHHPLNSSLNDRVHESTVDQELESLLHFVSYSQGWLKS